ncbi:stress enhanced protein 2, chloroplastic-like [Zingiber officinale]|uniref:stress enhanced protein 2, chloroplastic-like n=1 Tax=Zingiber officinale TaxID=94328 RepID=UPI001C4CA19D|nr:stress enhanced protein 2, chloroplastic-like [Zingiber officinale]
MAAATAIAGAIVCELGKKQHRPSNRDQALPTRGVRLPEPPAGGGKIVLQPRLCTLRSYGGNDAGVMRKSEKDASPFFASLADYIESSRKSQQFEIASGRLAMVALAAAVSVELVTGNSIFKKLDLQQIAEAGGVCVAVIVCAATFAWISSARTRIRQMITLGCNSFVDSLIDSAVEALFCDSELSDWSDEM